ncbi:MAG: 2-oxo acid dehydrogenase subunit E2 [Bacteroidales bacterium]|nr:2-oxo acid dehydrogenase subunit E2 [Bacteroidales bacterium]
MALFEILMPKMGESIEEATITKWFVKEGDKVVEDDLLLEIATDKVDSEIPSPVEGVVQKILYKLDDIVAVGSVIAIINMDGDAAVDDSKPETATVVAEKIQETETKKSDAAVKPAAAETIESVSGRFYSPLVKKIAKEEGISQQELDSIPGSGLNGRVQKDDILSFVKNRSGVKAETQTQTPTQASESQKSVSAQSSEAAPPPVSISGGDEIKKMGRMRKLIADHMINSVKVSAHVTNMIESDVTRIVNWRSKVKDQFLKREGEKITYLPIFLEAAVKALKDFPMINSSVDGDNIIIKKNINLGIAVALPDYNLIVPVIKNADNYNLSGLTKELNRLASSARESKLKPEEIQGGTFTVTNFGSFGNTIGTPIINQPQVAILAVGAIEKKPAVIETPEGDVIGIRHKMFLSLTYDHRIIDGALGGSFLKRVSDYLENFDINRTV